MEIFPSDRVVYEHNPLAEVVCQIRFDRLPESHYDAIQAFRKEYSCKDYPEQTEAETLGFSVQIAEGNVAHPTTIPALKIFHNATTDGVWRVSVCSEFIALTCSKYKSWDEFLPRIRACAEAFSHYCPDTSVTRVGLRYKDVIEREPLNLEGTPWHELIRPFLLGPLSPEGINEVAPPEEDIGSFVSQALLRLNQSSLLLQGSLLTSADGDTRAFLIDGDFFCEGSVESGILSQSELLASLLEHLHESAGALFRRCITEKLHHALGPK